MAFADALERIDDLRDTADALGAAADARRSEEDNLAFHLVWAHVRRAYGGRRHALGGKAPIWTSFSPHSRGRRSYRASKTR